MELLTKRFVEKYLSHHEHDTEIYEQKEHSPKEHYILTKTLVQPEKYIQTISKISLDVFDNTKELPKEKAPQKIAIKTLLEYPSISEE